MRKGTINKSTTFMCTKPIHELSCLQIVITSFRQCDLKVFLNTVVLVCVNVHDRKILRFCLYPTILKLQFILELTYI